MFISHLVVSCLYSLYLSWTIYKEVWKKKKKHLIFCHCTVIKLWIFSILYIISKISFNRMIESILINCLMIVRTITRVWQMEPPCHHQQTVQQFLPWDSWITQHPAVFQHSSGLVKHLTQYALKILHTCTLQSYIRHFYFLFCCQYCFNNTCSAYIVLCIFFVLYNNLHCCGFAFHIVFCNMCCTVVLETFWQ